MSSRPDPALAFSHPLPVVLSRQRLSGTPLNGKARHRVSYRRSARVIVTAVLQEEPTSTADAPSSSPEEPPSERSGIDSIPESVQNAFLLTLVPFLWGTYGVSGKLVLQGDYPMPLSVLNLAFFFFAFVSIFATRRLDKNEPQHDPEGVAFTQRAGAELGLYLYIGSVMDLAALSFTSASRSAFLVQLTTVIVPFGEWLLGARLSPAVAAACMVALSGAGVLSMEASPDVHSLSAPVLGALNRGDLLAIGSALFYSMQVLRLERLSERSVGALILVESKVFMQFALSVVAVFILLAKGDSSIPDYFNNFPSLPPSIMLKHLWWSFWIGAGTTSLATWLQVKGQERVGPSRAAVFYACQPVFAAGLACALGLDRLTLQEVLGGALIAGAGLMLAVVDRGESPKQEK